MTIQPSQEVLRQLLRGRVEILAHPDAGMTFVARHVNLAQELRGDREQGVLGPGLQPVDSATVHQRGELADPSAKTVADRRHRHHHVQVLAHRLHEEVKECHRATVCLYGSKQFRKVNITLFYINYYFNCLIKTERYYFDLFVAYSCEYFSWSIFFYIFCHHITV